MSIEEKECKCSELRHEHNKRLVEVLDLVLTISKSDDPEYKKVRKTVSGRLCSLCNKLDLTSFSRSILMKVICPTKPELVGLEEILNNTVVEREYTKQFYSAYELFIWGISPVKKT